MNYQINQIGKDVIRFFMLIRKNDAHLDFDLEKCLEETKENSSDADWELIAFMARPKELTMPMGPITMMRNQLQKEGGTKGEYSSENWAKSVDFWQRYAIKA